MIDFVLRVGALACFAGSLGVIGYYVPEPDLLIVLVLVAIMAIYDFLVRPFLVRARNSNNR
ncbi:MAG: hypothetical protein R3D05_14025 [Dongiaceae bacterium]